MVTSQQLVMANQYLAMTHAAAAAAHQAIVMAGASTDDDMGPFNAGEGLALALALNCLAQAVDYCTELLKIPRHRTVETVKQVRDVVAHLDAYLRGDGHMQPARAKPLRVSADPPLFTVELTPSRKVVMQVGRAPEGDSAAFRLEATQELVALHAKTTEIVRDIDRRLGADRGRELPGL